MHGRNLGKRRRKRLCTQTKASRPFIVGLMAEGFTDIYPHLPLLGEEIPKIRESPLTSRHLPHPRFILDATKPGAPRKEAT